jgi:hypothetical protein
MPLNLEVTSFLDQQNHPLRRLIDAIRSFILNVEPTLSENIKWNGPNFSYEGQDRITVKINPPKQIQLIFHRGAKVLEQPKDKLITEDFGLLLWKENDRAIATIKNEEEFLENSEKWQSIIKQWISKNH